MPKPTTRHGGKRTSKGAERMVTVGQLELSLTARLVVADEAPVTLDARVADHLLDGVREQIGAEFTRLLRKALEAHLTDVPASRKGAARRGTVRASAPRSKRVRSARAA